MSLLTLQDVSMAYNGKVLALQHIDLTVKQGEWLAIMGPSGSGKTTLMNIIGCMDHATSGHIVLDTVDLMNVTNHELTQLRRDKIGMVFQQFHLIPYLTAVENIMVAQYYHSMPDKKQALEMLDRVGLADRAAHLPSQLSGGQQQRVAIGRALITRPSLILADEPTGNLDSQNSSEVIALLKETSKKYEQTIIMITHNRSIAQTADRVLQVSDGTLTDFGRCRE